MFIRGGELPTLIRRWTEPFEELLNLINTYSVEEAEFEASAKSMAGVERSQV